MTRLDCVGSIEGWLFMVDSALRRPEDFMKPWSFYLQDHHSFDTAYFLLNPITAARVLLPSTPQSTFPCGCENGPGFVLTKLTASFTPTSSSQYCFFVASICIKGHVDLDELTPTIPWEVIAGTHLNIPYKTIQFGVFKLKPDDPDPQISPVFDLGDRILFVSRSGCKIMRATSDALKYNPNGDQAQLLERNRIYFAFDDFCVESASSEHEFGMFSLATKRVEFFPWPFLKNSSSRVRLNSRPVWFTPNL
ncbi:hypothetical protein ACLB2K_036983 [Fragaria x ananassa]